MANNAYQRGSALERRVKKSLEEEGYLVVKGGGSKGSFDLLACKASADTLLVQVKGDKAGPFAHFGPEARCRLLGDASRAGAVPWLVWNPGDRGGARWLGVGSWPWSPNGLGAEFVAVDEREPGGEADNPDGVL